MAHLLGLLYGVSHDGPRGSPQRASAYEISKSTGFHMDFRFQNGFLDFKVDFWISKWISGFQSGFLDFRVDFWISDWISGFHSGFLDFSLDFWISIGFLPTVYEISFMMDPLDGVDVQYMQYSKSHIIRPQIC